MTNFTLRPHLPSISDFVLPISLLYSIKITVDKLFYIAIIKNQIKYITIFFSNNWFINCAIYRFKIDYAKKSLWLCVCVLGTWPHQQKIRFNDSGKSLWRNKAGQNMLNTFSSSWFDLVKISLKIYEPSAIY